VTVSLQLDYVPKTIFHLGPGSGGIAMAHHVDIQQTSALPVRMKEVSDIYDCNFQFMCTLARGHTLIEMIRRTFQSRIPNPISRVFIGYPLENPGMISRLDNKKLSVNSEKFLKSIQIVSAVTVQMVTIVQFVT